MALYFDLSRFLLHNLGQLDEVLLKSDSSIATIFRAVCLIANWLAYDENVQVHGLKCLVDWTNLTLQHATRLYRPENIKRLFHFFEVGISFQYLFKVSICLRLEL